MITLQQIKTTYADLLYRFAVGLIHDETQAQAIVVICFEHLEKNIDRLKTEQDAQRFLEAGARKLCLNFLQKLYTQ